ncbi:DUF2617 family protein [Corynebacterium sp. H113]|uniref:DUF2617 family protein n=1 Tax=Corynebacterium sp. H113 TaxID=3133419 RepID=UPI0030B67876
MSERKEATVLLDVAFADVSAAQLSLAMNGEVPEMLESITVESASTGAGQALTLGILGSSHVAFIGERDRPEFVEELSCTAVDGVPLAEARVPGNNISVRQLSSDGFGAVVKQVRELEGSNGSLIAEFPGAADALTAVHGWTEESGFRWRTWHLYPDGSGGGEVVETETEWIAPVRQRNCVQNHDHDEEKR